MGQIWGFFCSDFSAFGAPRQMHWNLIWKSPRFVSFEAILTHFGAKPTIPVSVLVSRYNVFSRLPSSWVRVGQAAYSYSVPLLTWQSQHLHDSVITVLIWQWKHSITRYSISQDDQVRTYPIWHSPLQQSIHLLSGWGEFFIEWNQRYLMNSEMKSMVK